MLLTRTSLLIDRSKTERTYFLCVHVRWNWTQMCYVTSVIRHMVRLIECHRSMIPRKKNVQIFNGISSICGRKVKAVYQVRFVGDKLLSSACFQFPFLLYKY